jgi:hypothetical protein
VGVRVQVRVGARSVLWRKFMEREKLQLMEVSQLRGILLGGERLVIMWSKDDVFEEERGRKD